MRRSSKNKRRSTVNESGSVLDEGGPSEEEKLSDLKQEVVNLAQNLPQSDERIGPSVAFDYGRKLARVSVRSSRFLALASTLI